MSVSIDLIKELREMTGVSMTQCKKALEEAHGDRDKAIDILRKKGEAKAVDSRSRNASEGIISSYIHSNSKIGVMVELNCETDFVAKSDDFKQLGQDIAMHIAASDPLTINPEDVPEQLVEKEKEIWKEQLKNEGKPEAMLDKIMQGKEQKFRQEKALLTQAFVKNPDLTMQKLLSEYVARLGENIRVNRFQRFQI